MRHALAILAVAVLAGVCPGGDAGKKALAEIQGTWRFISVEMDGKKSPPEEFKGRTITFSGDKWAVRQGEKTLQAGTHKFDPGKKARSDHQRLQREPSRTRPGGQVALSRGASTIRNGRGR
jgi:uncharacterized protein (TIGR03067 family)